MRIIVTTHDAYSNIVPVFIEHFEKTWPDCPYPLHFVGCSKIPEVAYNYNVALMGEDKDWSSALLEFLGDSDEPFLLLMIDFFLTDILWEQFDEALWAIDILTVGQVRLKPCPGPAKNWYRELGEIDKQKPYAVSLQAALWKPQVLRDLLRPGENHYQAELRGSKRARDYAKYTFLATWDWIVKYKEYYMRGGKPDPETVKWLGREV